MPSVQTMQPMAAIPTPSLPVIEAPIAPFASEAPKEASGTGTAKSYLVKSTNCWNFYRSPVLKTSFCQSWRQDIFGSVVCIIEAMKLFNEIESDILRNHFQSIG